MMIQREMLAKALMFVHSKINCEMLSKALIFVKMMIQREMPSTAPFLRPVYSWTQIPKRFSIRYNTGIADMSTNTNSPVPLPWQTHYLLQKFV